MRTHATDSALVHERTALPSGRIVSWNAGPVPLFVRRPPGEIRGVLIAVHGNTRQATLHALRFADHAEAAQLLLIAPLFTRSDYPRFQRLGDNATDDLNTSLLTLLRELGLPFRSWLWFGHSAGAQFVHRYIYQHPEHVRRAVLSAAGWYTLPDETVDFPYGLHALANRADLKCVLQVPQRVLVGDHDVLTGDALRRTRELDLQQGRDRVERAQTYVEAMRALARANGVSPAVSLRVLKGAGHDFDTNIRRARLGIRTLRFLTSGSDQASTARRSCTRAHPDTAPQHDEERRDAQRPDVH